LGRKRRESESFPTGRIVALLLFLIAVSGLAYIYLSKRPSDAESSVKAAIIDGLKGFPNPEFIDETTKMLSENNFTVDLYRDENVTVEFYKKLPSLGYSLIVLRVHCGPLVHTLPNGTKEVSQGIVIFTTEEYNQEMYLEYQLCGLLARARMIGREKLYFAIPPQFVYDAMQGRFNNTIIILDSCYGLFGKPMPEAFISRGVSKFVGWDGEVTANHADEATLTLLREYLNGGLSIEEALLKIEPDPFYGSSMHCYPP
jgi:hypothetical protein